MKNFGKKLGSMALALVMAFGLLTTAQFGALAQGEKLFATKSASFSAQSIQPAAVKTGDDGTTNWDFIEPVTHKKSVPSGYIGISTAAQLNAVRNNLNKNYILMANIDLSGWGNWVPIGGDENAPFKGAFDGNGYVIKNMTVNVKSANSIYAGLFGYCYAGSIKNLGMLGGSVITSSASYYSHYVGGIAGDSSSSISNCYNTGNVRASSVSHSEVGGIVGISSSSISNCYNTGEVSASSASYSSYAGGIAGYSSSASIINCHNTGDVRASSASYSYAGGIAGYSSSASSSISICYNAGDVSASSSASYSPCAGGIAGDSSSSISNCYNIGDVSASPPRIIVVVVQPRAGRDYG